MKVGNSDGMDVILSSLVRKADQATFENMTTSVILW